MEKTTLKLHELYTLEAEVSGVRNRETGEPIVKGILASKLSLPTRYWVTDLAKKVGEEKKSIDTLRDELVKKFGKEQDGMISIPIVIDKVDETGAVVYTEKDGEQVPDKMPNPEFEQFQKEYAELMEQERDVEHFAFKLHEFASLEGDEQYTVFMKLLKP